jgi:hypothetical protein
MLFAHREEELDLRTHASHTALKISPDNFKRAETDMHLAMFVKEGAFSKFFHHRDLPLENTGVRPNRDTLYSYAVFDLDAGPVTISLPDAGKRFMSLMVITQDHYALETVYTPRESRSVHAISSLQRALSSIRPNQKTSTRHEPCRMQ